jgi:3-hydroxybutyryl-CoA dehydrogenase
MISLKGLKIGIIGTGTIGTAYAALFTGNKYPVKVLAISDSFINDGKKKYGDLYDIVEQRGLITAAQRKKCQEFLTYTTFYEDLYDADIIFECVFEDIAVKFKVYEEIEKHCDNLKAIVSTTSAYSPDDLRQGLKKYSSKMVVAHPFNPPHLVLFVELIKSRDSDSETVRLIYDFLESCGRKVCIMKKSAPGFIANRLQHALVREALHMVDSGLVDAADIDKALKYSFMPRYTVVGLFEHQDLFGMDQLQNLQNYLYPHLSTDKASGPTVNNCVKNGNLGQKTGKGIYEWNQDSINAFKKNAAEPYWQYFNWNLP